MSIFISTCVAILISVSVAANEEAPPNVLIIMTDEHNLRTLGCYRDLMVQSQAEIWGEGITVSTPNIDSLGKAGALLSNFLTVSPQCTPSRGSFLTGEYPSTHGAANNHVPMNDDAITFAEILKDRLGYSASYMGKVSEHPMQGKQMQDLFDPPYFKCIPDLIHSVSLFHHPFSGT